MTNQVIDKQTIFINAQAEYYTLERAWLIIGAKRCAQLPGIDKFRIRGKFRFGCEPSFLFGEDSIGLPMIDYTAKTDQDARFQMLRWALTEMLRERLPSCELESLRTDAISIVSPVPEFLESLEKQLQEKYEYVEDAPEYVKYLRAFKRVVAVTVTNSAAKNLFKKEPDNGLLREIYP